MKQNKHMTMASVFSGIGGEMVAATMMGWDVQFFCEKNEFGRTVLEYWYPNAKSYEDITTTDFSEWRGRIDVLTGGFPCQPFSYAGKRGGATDDRYLWPFMFRCIDQIRPTWVVAENVAGISTMVEQGEVSKMASAPTLFDEGDDVRGEYVMRETFTLERISDDLERHGYSVQTVLIPALSVGAPHRRDRVFIVARRRDTANTADNGLQHGVDTRSERGETGEIQGQRYNAERNVPVASNGFGGNSSDTAIEGLERRNNCDTQGHGQSEDGRAGLPCQGMGGERHTANSESKQCKQHGFEQPEHSSQRQVELGGSSLADDTENAMCNGRTIRHEEERSEDIEYWNTRAGDTEWLCGKARLEDSDEVGSRWREFPTVSPVHAGNDGLCFDVADLSISFPKWRNESLKACGNAIVPQAVYEIFRAIQHVENIQH